MNAKQASLVLLLGAGLVALPVAADVRVTFRDPAQYVDAGGYGPDSVRALREIRQHLDELGRRYLSPDQTLHVDVLELDLAGNIEWPTEYIYGVRVLRGGADWPRIALRYRLETDGQVQAQGEDDLSDKTYLLHTPSYFAEEPLRYEKAMLDDWFKTRFVESRVR